MLPVKNMVQNKSFLHISHRHTTPTRDTNRCTTATFVSNTKCLQVYSPREWSAPQKNFSPLKNGSRWHGQQEVTDPCTLHRTAQRHSAKTLHLTRHLTLHGTLDRHGKHRRHRQHTPLQTPFSSPKLETGSPGALFCFVFCVPRKW